MALYPSASDSANTLWKKAAANLYDYAISRGVTGLTPPNWNDSSEVLRSKIAYYTAATVEAHP